MFAVLRRLLGGLGPSRGTWSGPILDPPMTLWLVGGPYISFLPPNLFQTSCSIFNSPENTAIQAIQYAHIGFQV